MKTFLVGLAAAAFLLQAGCNAVYYYETDKVSLTLEARPDSTAPIQGNLGVKQRIVAFVPKRNGNSSKEPVTPEQASALADRVIGEGHPPSGDPNALNPASAAPAAHATEAVARAAALPRTMLHREIRDALADTSDSDAMDVLSSMRFHKLPKPDGAPWYKAGHMTIDAALITGGAARHVASPAAAIAALSGQAIPGGFGTIGALRGIYSALKEARQNGDAQATDLVTGLDALGPTLPQQYPFTDYEQAVPAPPVPAAFTTNTNIKAGANITNRRNFNDVLAYGGTIQLTREHLRNLLAADPATTTLDGQPISAATRQRIQDELQRLDTYQTDFVTSFVRSRAVRAAATYFSNHL